MLYDMKRLIKFVCERDRGLFRQIFLFDSELPRRQFHGDIQLFPKIAYFTELIHSYLKKTTNAKNILG